MDTYKNESWMRLKYIVEDLSISEIANEQNVPVTTIQYYVRKFNLKKDPSIHYIDLECPTCGSPFQIKRHKHTSKVNEGRSNFFCSKECNSKWRSDLFKNGRALELLKAQTRDATSIERAIRSALESLNVNFIMQHQVGYYVVDFYLPDSNVVIECHGDYWHANPSKYNKDNLHPKQRRNVSRDKSKRTFLVNRGYTLIELWETEIKHDYVGCIERIKQSILIRRTKGGHAWDFVSD